MERYGDRAAEYYYDSYTPRVPDHDLPRRQYYPDRSPVHQSHHYDNEADREVNYMPDSHFAETHYIRDVRVSPHWDEPMTYDEPEYSHLIYQGPAHKKQPHDYLVMHRPKHGQKHGKYSEEKSNPHFDHDGKYTDEDLPRFEPLNVDPPQTKTPKK